MKLSIVIPVYNEEDTLKACLESISRQTVMPDEVIVVDNNSSDASISIARQYKFIKIIRENRQGISYARNTGFDYASGDIIGRIDADTILDDIWVETVKEIFKDKSISAVSGKVGYYDGLWPKFNSIIDHFFRSGLSNKMPGNLFLYGANMAISKQAWLKIKQSVCNDEYIHEDLDIAIHLNNLSFKVIFSTELTAKISCRRFSRNINEVSDYANKTVATYREHNRRLSPYFYIIWSSLFIFYWYVFLNALYYKKSLKRRLTSI